MHIYITGSTGRNGKLTLQAALANNHTVTALVRNPSSLTPHPNLTIIQGTPTSQADVQRALTTPKLPQAIISTLSLRRTSDSPFAPLSPDSPPDFLESTMKTLIAAMKSTFPATKLPKLIVNSSMGAGSSEPAMSMPIRFIFKHTAMRFTLQGHNNMDEIVRQSGLTFVLARAARLVDGQEAGDLKALSDDGKGCGWNPTTNRGALGRWMVEAAETDTWDDKSPVVID